MFSLTKSTKVVSSSVARRMIHTTAPQNLKIVCALYPDPEMERPEDFSKMPYYRNELPEIKSYPDGQTVPNPKAIDFTPGHLLGCESGALGLKDWLAKEGHEFIVTTDKDGPDSVLEKELVDADIVISQPFYPAYITKERIAKSPKLKLAITAGIGSDHVDLTAACASGMTVAEVTFCNSISVAEHVVMMILGLVRNYIPSHAIARTGGWNIADCVHQAYDVEGMNIGTVAAGRIGLAVLRRMNPFNVKLHYTDRHRLSPEIEKELNLTYHAKVEDMVKVCDVVTINCPLHPETENLFDEKMLRSMKRGSYIVNTARGLIVNREAIVKACEDGHIAGYAGDVWYPQPPPADHPWRNMLNNGMTPHISGTTLSAQARYAAGVREILENYFENKPIRNEYLIADKGKLAGAGAVSYSLEK